MMTHLPSRITSINERALCVFTATSMCVALSLTVALGTASSAYAQESPKVSAESGADKDQPHLAVLPLRNRLKMSQDEHMHLNEIILDSVAEHLTGQYTLISQELIEKSTPKDINLDECTRACQIQMGQQLSSRYLIVSKIFRFGDSIRLTMRLLDTQHDRLIIKQVIKGRDLEQIESSIAPSLKPLITSLTSYVAAGAKAKTSASADGDRKAMGPIVDLGGEIVVNLRSLDGKHRLLRTRLEIEVDSKKTRDEVKSKIIMIRYRITRLLTSRRPEEVIGPSQMEQVRVAMKQAAQTVLESEGKVVNVWPSEWILE